MPKRAAGPLIALLNLDRARSTPLHRQLYEELRAAILTERLKSGERLPSTRTLAGELGVSRRTVLDAFLQLYAEGFVEGRIGAGTFVAFALPEELFPPTFPPAMADLPAPPPTPRFSKRFQSQQQTMPPTLAEWSPPKLGRLAFQIGIPALDAFPSALWGRLVRRLGREFEDKTLARDDLAGYRPLREAVAGYLAASRGVRCTPDQVLIVNGSQQALSLIAHVLLDPGDSAWVEEPGYFGAKGALLGAGARLIPVPVDDDGLNVDAGRALCPDARLAFVTPSHQMPLGVTMSLSRRLALLEWARKAGAWIVEDDYDSEFRYASRPLAALQALDTSGRVLYTGTFSKVLFPALRLGYMVVPPALASPIMTARVFTDLYSPLLEQRLVTAFIQEGHFERHVRRMRELYAERQEVLVNAARRDLSGRLELAPVESGMHLVGRLPPGIDDIAAAHAAREQGVRTLPLSRQYIHQPAQGGLILGYAAVPPPEILEGVRALRKPLRNEK